MIRTSLRFRPYCKEMPVTTLIPQTTLFAKISPGMCEIFDGVTQKKVLEKVFTFGPLKQFTVTLDLECNAVVVTGFAKASYIRYRIDVSGIHFEKGDAAGAAEAGSGFENLTSRLRLGHKSPKPEMAETEEGSGFENLTTQHGFGHKSPKPDPLLLYERLSCGCGKAQDIARIMRHGELREWLPIWYFLAQKFPICPDVEDEKGPSILQELREIIQSNDRRPLSEKLTQLFQEASTSLLSPCEDHSLLFGHHVPPIAVMAPASPQLMLQKSFALIRSLFFVEEKETLSILPLLPVPLHAGKLVNLKCSAGLVSLEWTKGSMRRIFFEPTQTCSYRLKFSEDIKRFKLRSLPAAKEIGDIDAPIHFVAGKRYLLDCFQR